MNYAKRILKSIEKRKPVNMSLSELRELLDSKPCKCSHGHDDGKPCQMHGCGCKKFEERI